MTPKEYKYKPGDLVQHSDKEYRFKFGLGIIIGPQQALLGPAYQTFWTKKDLCWFYERYLERVSK